MMMAAIHSAIPDHITNIYSSLLQHGIHPTAWKPVKCILIPKHCKKEKDDAKSYGPLSLFRCLGKTLEKNVLLKLVYMAAAIGAITDNQMGSRVLHSSATSILDTLTAAQERLLVPIRPGNQNPPTHSLIANDIDGAFNTVRHERLTELMTLPAFPQYLINFTRDFCGNRFLGFALEDAMEEAKPFLSGLPLSYPVLIGSYSSPTVLTSRTSSGGNSIYKAEIDVIRETTAWLLLNRPASPNITICVDNQGTLNSLRGHKCMIKEDLRICLDGLNMLRQVGCNVKGLWSGSHGDISGNEKADTLLNEAQNYPTYSHAKTTLL